MIAGIEGSSKFHQNEKVRNSDTDQIEAITEGGGTSVSDDIRDTRHIFAVRLVTTRKEATLFGEKKKIRNETQKHTDDGVVALLHRRSRDKTDGGRPSDTLTAHT